MIFYLNGLWFCWNGLLFVLESFLIFVGMVNAFCYRKVFNFRTNGL